MGCFVLVSEQGPGWHPGHAMREQEKWTEHAAFINALAASGFILLGGPLGSGHPHRAQLVLNSPSEEDVRARLADDPWMREGILRIVSVEPWTILVTDDRLDPALAKFLPPSPPK